MKSVRNYVLDFFIFLCFVLTSVTGLAMFFVPRGNIKGNWVSIHEWAGIVMLILVAVHVALHWKWIKVMTRSVLKIK